MIDLFIFFAAAIILFLAMAISILRAILGPTIADRVISVDASTTISLSAFILLAVFYKQVILIDVAIVYAMLSFGSTLYFAHYLGEKHD